MYQMWHDMYNSNMLIKNQFVEFFSKGEMIKWFEARSGEINPQYKYIYPEIMWNHGFHFGLKRLFNGEDVNMSEFIGNPGPKGTILSHERD